MGYIFVMINGTPICERLVAYLKMSCGEREVSALKLADGTLIRAGEGIDLGDDEAAAEAIGGRDIEALADLVDTWLSESAILAREGRRKEAKAIKDHAAALEDAERALRNAEFDEHAATVLG